MANIERLTRALAWVEGEHEKAMLGLPSEWDQSRWFNREKPEFDCGSACCLAGKVTIEDGYNRRVVQYWHADKEVYSADLLQNSNGINVDVSDHAQRELDLTRDQADALFHADNNIDDMRRIIAALIAGEGFTDADGCSIDANGQLVYEDDED